MNVTPNSNRLHITLYGRRNSGKSSLLNALTGQEAAVVSPVAGTTTDPVGRAMEIMGLGPCLLTDTPGFDDEGQLGGLRTRETRLTLERADVAMMVCTPTGDYSGELQWAELLRDRGIPVLWVLNKVDLVHDPCQASSRLEEACGQRPVEVSALRRWGIDRLLEALRSFACEAVADEVDIVRHLVAEGDTVLLVMPQDPQAPRGRLILPQVQTLRELLDARCLALCCTVEGMRQALSSLSVPPKLIVTDSQAFAEVKACKPPESRLTSFSVLFARHKGDIGYYMASARRIDELGPASHVLIAEACTHAPASEDIGRVKLPRLLRQRAGGELSVTVVAGKDFPDDLSPYDLVIHCGACMFNRRHVLNRIAQARRQGVPMTNYGIAIAYMKGILDEVCV